MCDSRQKRIGVKGKTTLVLLALLFIAGALGTVWYSQRLKIALPTNVISKERLISILNIGASTSLLEECNYKMQSLTTELTRVEHALRRFKRKIRLLTISSYGKNRGISSKSIKYIGGVSVTKGSDTEEYRSLVTLWGVVPLWKTAPSPDTVIALRQPKPTDCWPIVGAVGEIIMELPRHTHVRGISIEHIRPDANRSAPKHFILYGILQNGTTVTAIEAEYKHSGPGKQYYRTKWNKPLKQLVFRVLSNQGNSKYTCLYRVHIYEPHASGNNY